MKEKYHHTIIDFASVHHGRPGETTLYLNVDPYSLGPGQRSKVDLIVASRIR
jgi:hypothetical protein